jgi:ribosomal protein S20
MATIKLEAQKASLAREILNLDNETVISRIWTLLKNSDSVIEHQKESKQRKIGLLDGKAKIEFRDDFAITTEELLSV